MIPGIVVEVGPEAVVVSSSTPLVVLSSAVSGGGLSAARAIINLHVSKDDRCDDPDGMLSRFASRAGIARPYVGLLTSAWTEHAAVAEAQAFDMRALAVITVGLGNLVAAGVDPVAVWAPSTINAVIAQKPTIRTSKFSVTASGSTPAGMTEGATFRMSAPTATPSAPPSAHPRRTCPARRCASWTRDSRPAPRPCRDGRGKKPSP